MSLYVTMDLGVLQMWAKVLANGSISNHFKSLSDDGAILEGNGHLAAPHKNLNFVGH